MEKTIGAAAADAVASSKQISPKKILKPTLTLHQLVANRGRNKGLITCCNLKYRFKNIYLESYVIVLRQAQRLALHQRMIICSTKSRRIVHNCINDCSAILDVNK